jgi:hypothetical protein
MGGGGSLVTFSLPAGAIFQAIGKRSGGRRNTMIRKHFRLKRIALGLAFAAVAVPTAQASVLLDGHSAPVSYTAVAHQPIASEISVQSGVPSAAGRRAALAGNGEGL